MCTSRKKAMFFKTAFINDFLFSAVALLVNPEAINQLKKTHNRIESKRASKLALFKLVLKCIRNEFLTVFDNHSAIQNCRNKRDIAVLCNFLLIFHGSSQVKNKSQVPLKKMWLRKCLRCHVVKKQRFHIWSLLERSQQNNMEPSYARTSNHLQCSHLNF